jgi:5-oxoprolinase (ATP-hydrolysing) subunit A
LRRWIDLNCDMGEVREAIADGTQESLMPNLTSVNIACGGHAGDEQTMKATIQQALRWNLGVGAHPGYADPANFGREELNISLDEIADSVYEQVRRFAQVATGCGVRVAHVKAHGALYNQAARDPAIAGAVAAGVARWSREVVLMGLAGSPMLDVFRNAGFAVAAEAFADRRYEPDGTLRARKFEDALIRDPSEAAQQALRIVEQGTAQTICIHGDTPGAPKIAEAVAKLLREAGMELRTLGDGLRTAS